MISRCPSCSYLPAGPVIRCILCGYEYAAAAWKDTHQQQDTGRLDEVSHPRLASENDMASSPIVAGTQALPAAPLEGTCNDLEDYSMVRTPNWRL